MTTDARWEQDLTTALHPEYLSSSVQPGFPSSADAAWIRPTHAESARAVANIRTWRAYLPAACVSAMVAEGWQWST